MKKQTISNRLVSHLLSDVAIIDQVQATIEKTVKQWKVVKL